MADLKSLFAKKANQTNGSDNTAHGQPSNKASAEQPQTSNNDSTSDGKLEAPPPATQATPSESGNPKPKALAFRVGGGGGQPSQQPTPSVESGSGGVQPKPGLSSLSVNPGTRDSDSDPGGVAVTAIASLDDLDSTAESGSEPKRSSVKLFDDETPATKPTRELPEGVTKEQLGFIDLLDGIYEIIHDPDLLGGVIRNIMVELKSNPEYTKLMAPDDFRTMVRGMRESMGLARVKKQEAKTKRSNGGSKKSKALDDDIMAGLDEVLAGIDI